MIKNNRKTFKINILFLLIFFLFSSCIPMTFKKGASFNNKRIKLFKDTIYINETDKAFIDVYCGKTITFLGFLLPIPLFPISFEKNSCENKGFIVYISGKKFKNEKIINLNKKNKIYSLRVKLKYNNQTYNSILLDKYGFKSIFKISNYEEFKKAKDKTLIIHKKRNDGTVIIEEMPFEWKIFLE